MENYMNEQNMMLRINKWIENVECGGTMAHWMSNKHSSWFMDHDFMFTV